jgi:dolichol-phosphate mannosyltransferase
MAKKPQVRAEAAVADPAVSVIVPALNEEATIREVIDRLLALPLTVQVIAVDNGSTDGTTAVLESFGDRITLLRNDEKTGKGESIVQAIPFLRGRATIIQDADIEYFPEDIPTVVQPILDGTAAVVYGSRFHHGLIEGMALPNKLVNLMLAWSVRLLYFQKLTDEATCYKAFRTDLLGQMNLQCVRFEFCPEATAKAIRLGNRIIEVPVRYVPRNKAAGKKIRWTDAPEAFWTLLRYRFGTF